MADAKGCPGFPESDFEPQDGALILALRGDQMPAAIEHADGDGRKPALARNLQRLRDDAVGCFRGSESTSCVPQICKSAALPIASSAIDAQSGSVSSDQTKDASAAGVAASLSAH